MNTQKKIILLGMLEKFAFNGLRAMLTIMLIKTFNYQEKEAFQFYAVSLMMSFLVPIFAGILIKKGEKDISVMKAGGVLLTIGFIVLASSLSNTLYLGMGLIILGAGMIRATIPALLGKNLTQDENGDAAFSLLYVGYNIGTLAGSLIFAGLGELMGWEISFVLGAVSGILICLLLQNLDSQSSWGSKVTWPVAAIALIALLYAPHMPVNYIDFLMMAIILIVPFALVWPLLMNKEVGKAFLLLSVLPSIVIFFALYEQAAMSLTTFTDSFVDRNFLGFLVPTTMFQGIDPFFNIALGIVFAFIWKTLTLKDGMITSFLKIILGLGFTWLSFLSLILFVNRTGASSPLSLWGFYLIIVTGELLLVPVLLSLVNSSLGKERASLNMSFIFVLIGASMWLAQYLIRIDSTTGADLNFYLGLFDNFSAWAMWAFIIPCISLIIVSMPELIKKRVLNDT